MGTDIHFIVQKRINNKWEDVTVDTYKYKFHDKVTVPGEFHWEGDRHYYLFAWLADVRNGHGFAGVKTFEPVRPVTSHRGLPPDVKEGTYDSERDEFTGYDLGDHSQGWALASEILAHPRPPIVQTGVISRDEYIKYVNTRVPPESWSGGISGLGIKVVDSKDFKLDSDATHVSCTWVQATDYLDTFVNAFKEMAEKYGAENVRIVFGFDS